MVFLALFLATTQVAKVTLSFPPTPVRKAVELLGQASGRKLTSSKSLDDEVVLAQLKNASVDSALAHLAESLCAKWEDLPDGSKRLIRDGNAERKLAAADEAAVEKMLDDGLNYLRKRLKEQPEELNAKSIKTLRDRKVAETRRQKAARDSRDQDRMFLPSAVDEEDPDWRAAAQIVLLLGTKVLSGMPKGAREVWSDHPTNMQLPFPDGVDRIFDKYRREASLFRPNAPEMTHLKFVVNRSGNYSSATLLAQDPNGNSISKVVVPVMDRSLAKVPVSQRPGFAKTSGELPIEVPEEVNQARIALCSFQIYRQSDRVSILSKFVPKFLDPVRNEPTQWHFGEDFILAAKALDKNLIGTVNDITFSRFWPATGSILSRQRQLPSQILTRFASDFLPTTDGWLVLRSHERRFRASRIKATELLRQAMRQGGVSVESAAGWAFQSTDDGAFTCWLGDYLKTLFPSSSDTLDNDQDLRLWGSLGSGVMDSLRHGETIKLSQLSTEAQTRIFQMVYWHGGLDDFSKDPTEVLPNGIVDGTMSLSIWEKPMIHGWSSKSGPQIAMSDLSVENIGIGLATKQNWIRGFDRYSVGVKRTFSLSILLEPSNVPMTVDLSESLFDPNSPKYQKLPESIAVEIELARLHAIANPTQAAELDGPMPISRGKRVFPPD